MSNQSLLERWKLSEQELTLIVDKNPGLQSGQYLRVNSRQNSGHSSSSNRKFLVQQIPTALLLTGALVGQHGGTHLVF